MVGLKKEDLVGLGAKILALHFGLTCAVHLCAACAYQPCPVSSHWCPHHSRQAGAAGHVGYGGSSVRRLTQAYM
eukprot:3075008-Ditylum_brightwellii.AAC.1